jgi:hypothetical protein
VRLGRAEEKFPPVDVLCDITLRIGGGADVNKAAVPECRGRPVLFGRARCDVAGLFLRRVRDAEELLCRRQDVAARDDIRGRCLCEGAMERECRDRGSNGLQE